MRRSRRLTAPAKKIPLEWTDKITTAEEKRLVDYLGKQYARSPEYARKQFGVRDGEYSKINLGKAQ